VSVEATGKAPFGYAWKAGACTVADPEAASTTVSCPASTVTQSLPVSVTVTQGDGQHVSAVAPVQLTGAAAHAWWWTPRLQAGAVVSALRTSAGGVAGRPATLQVRWVGTKAWTSVAQPTTGAAGRVSEPVDLARAGTYRFLSTGDGAVAGATSPAVLVKVATRVSSSHVGRRVVATLSTATGARVAGAAMVLQRKQGSHWRYVARARTNAAGQVAHTVRSRRTAAYRWLFRGESSHTSAVGRALRVG
jgi:hypothetical protein